MYCRKLGRRKKVMYFGSHFWGDNGFSNLLSMPSIEIVCLATDDPENKFCNPRKRLWRHGYDEALRNLVPARAKAYGLQPYTGRVNDPVFIKAIKQSQPDAIVSCVYGQRIPREILDICGRRAINVHLTVPGQPLSLTAGANNLQIAIEHGKYIEAILHVMEEEFDSGEELARSVPFRLPEKLIDGTALPHDWNQFQIDSAPLAGDLVRNNLMGILARDIL